MRGADDRKRSATSIRIENSRLNTEAELRSIVDAAGAEPVDVVIEATRDSYCVAVVVELVGANLHLAHPLGIKAYDNRRVKNDYKDAGYLWTMSWIWRDK